MQNSTGRDVEIRSSAHAQFTPDLIDHPYSIHPPYYVPANIRDDLEPDKFAWLRTNSPSVAAGEGILIRLPSDIADLDPVLRELLNVPVEAFVVFINGSLETRTRAAQFVTSIGRKAVVGMADFEPADASPAGVVVGRWATPNRYFSDPVGRPNTHAVGRPVVKRSASSEAPMRPG